MCCATRVKWRSRMECVLAHALVDVVGQRRIVDHGNARLGGLRQYRAHGGGAVARNNARHRCILGVIDKADGAARAEQYDGFLDLGAAAARAAIDHALVMVAPVRLELGIAVGVLHLALQFAMAHLLLVIEECSLQRQVAKTENQQHDDERDHQDDHHPQADVEGTGTFAHGRSEYLRRGEPQQHAGNDKPDGDAQQRHAEFDRIALGEHLLEDLRGIDAVEIRRHRMHRERDALVVDDVGGDCCKNRNDAEGKKHRPNQVQNHVVCRKDAVAAGARRRIHGQAEDVVEALHHRGPGEDQVDDHRNRDGGVDEVLARRDLALLAGLSKFVVCGV